jgi:hypothetical protein
MKKKWLKLAGEMLSNHASILGEAGCNDWKWPADWTQDERLEFVTLMVSDNVSRAPADFTEEDEEDVENMASNDTDYGPPDWLVAQVLATIIEKEVAKVPLDKLEGS